MNDLLDSEQAAERNRSVRARRMRTIRGSTAAFTVSLVIAFSAALAPRQDVGDTASASNASSSTAVPSAGTEVAIVQPERLVTSQS